MATQPMYRSSRGTPLAMPKAAEAAVCIRRYKGALDVATADAAEHAVYMKQAGYHEANRAYVPGSWSGGAFVVALLLCLFLVGILLLIGMIIVKPAGQLVVTYERDPLPGSS